MRDDYLSRVEIMPHKERQVMMDIIQGKAIPPLYLDAVAKKVLNPDVHQDRMNYLLRSIAKDETIDVACSGYSKGGVSDGAGRSQDQLAEGKKLTIWDKTYIIYTR